LLIKITLF